jgi:hypothetical protein
MKSYHDVQQNTLKLQQRYYWMDGLYY